jgi:hypothetical protein
LVVPVPATPPENLALIRVYWSAEAPKPHLGCGFKKTIFLLNAPYLKYEVLSKASKKRNRP